MKTTPVTEFQSRVYKTCRRIPRGKVTTYKLLAEALQCGSAQAIGQALKHNPFAPEVPCHRVIRTDGTLGGFAGHRAGQEIQRKQRLLKKEGVQFSDGKLEDASRIHRF